MEKFTTKQLVAFGNYLLSDARKQTIINQCNLNAVTHADIANFIETLKPHKEKHGKDPQENTVI